ncbi:MAG: SGNH/GDSL hydrolase family protein [Proteobacteria bacterium]|nr:SGNH/GDSL hydrolase family protein [Pseudomonadota bacterium]
MPTLLFLFFACSPTEPLVVEPATGPMSGYYAIRLETELDVSSVEVAGLATYGMTKEAGSIEVWVQGAKSSGPAEIVLETPEGPQVYEDAFSYDEPLFAGFDSLAALGASLTQGVQGGVPTEHGQLHSPSRQIALEVGAFHPVPLLVEDLFLTIGPEHIGPPPECEIPDVAQHLASSAADVLAKINDEENDRIGFYLAREDPDITPYNVAVGDSNVADLVNGPSEAEFSQQFLAHLMYDPYGDIIDKVEASQLELVEALNPTVVISTDTFGNDLIGGIVRSEAVDPTLLTPLDEFEEALVELVERMAATNAEVFLSNMPRATLLPLTKIRRQAALERGETEEEVDARLDEIEAMGDAYNAILAVEAAKFDNVHLVDLATEVATIEADGLQVGDQKLSVDKFDGLLSTDGIHFSDLGYAMIANLFIDKMNQVMDLDITEVDLVEVIEGDFHSPQALIDGGLDLDSCED